MSGNEGISESLYNIKHKSAAETYNASTDSLEAISDSLAAAGLGAALPVYAFTQGLAYVGVCNVGMAASTTVIASLDLAGFGNDFFNTGWVMIVLYNTNSHGAAPEGEYRDITDYTDATGSFVADAFTQNVEASDVIIVARRDIMGVAVTDALTDLNVADVVGRKADAAVTTAVTGKSLMAYQKGILAAVTNGTGNAMPLNQSTYDQFVKHRGDVFWGVAQSGATTGAVCSGLSGFGNDVFNNKYFLQVIYDAGGTAAAPEGEMRLITDYVSSSGEFVTTAFSAAIAVGDIVVVTRVKKQDGVQGPFTSSAATVNTITCADLADVASQYVGQMIVPLGGAMAGEARMITAYNGTSVLTIEPDWASDPDAATAINFLVMPTTNYWLYTTGRGLSSIFDIVDAISDLGMISDSLTTDGTEQTMWEVASPSGVFEPKQVLVDCTNLAAGDTMNVRIYYKIKSGGSYIKEVDEEVSGAQDPALLGYTLRANRYGTKVTVEETAGAHNVIDFEVGYYG